MCAPNSYPKLAAWLAAIALPALTALRPMAALAAATVEAKLANGLIVLVAPVHAAPVVSVGVLYKTGSRNEDARTTGVSHQVEHMMFKGTTDGLRPGDIDRLFIDNNATTGPDSTYYYETCQRSGLADALRIEADRMLHAAVDPSELARENRVVLEELDEGENDPRTVLDERVEATAMTAHQYRWPVIGWKPVVRTFGHRRGLVYGYYAAHYSPQNAVLAIAGDVEPAAALALVHRYFDRLQARPVAPLRRIQEPPQHGTRRVTVAGPGQTDWIELAYHVPGGFTPDSYTLAVLDALIAQGQSAQLYRSLVGAGLASRLDTASGDTVDPYLYTVAAPLESGVPFAAARSVIEGELAKLRSGGIGPREFARAKKQVVASYVFDHDGVESLAQYLATWRAWTGDWRNDQRYVPRVRAVTPARVRSFARRYLRPDNLTLGEYRANGSEAARHPTGKSHRHPHWRWARRAWRAASRSEGRVAQQAAFRPAPSVSPSRFVLPNGLVLIVQENHANPAVAFNVHVEAGSGFDPPGKSGLASLVQEMLLRGTASLSYDELQEAIDALGIDIQTDLDHSGATFRTQVLSEDEPRAFALLTDVLQYPRFDPVQLSHAREQLTADLQSAEDDPATVAEEALYRALYPPGDPWHLPPAGTVSGLAASGLANAESFYRHHYGPNDTVIVAAGDVSAAAMKQQALRALGAWRRATGQTATHYRGPSAFAPQFVEKTMPGKTQAEVAIGGSGVEVRSPDYEAARLMNFILGGPSFTSRYLHQVRETEGLVYDISSRFVEEAGGPGPWLVQFGTGPRNVERALEDVRGLAAALVRKGVTDVELAQARRLAVDDVVTAEQTNAGMAAELMRDELLRLGLDYARRLPQIYGAINAEQIRAAAKKYLHPDRLVISEVGPRP